jgi:hypothetical protein
MSEWWISRKDRNENGVVDVWPFTDDECKPYSFGPYLSKEEAERAISKMKADPQFEWRNSDLFVHWGQLPIRAEGAL